MESRAIHRRTGEAADLDVVEGSVHRMLEASQYQAAVDVFGNLMRHMAHCAFADMDFVAG